jgi:hypothetical protein
MPLGLRLVLSPSSARAIGEGWICQNQVLWFSLNLQIVLQLDKTQTVQASQGVVCWSSSLKYSCVCASTEKCVDKVTDFRIRSTMLGLSEASRLPFNWCEAMYPLLQALVASASTLPSSTTYEMVMTHNSMVHAWVTCSCGSANTSPSDCWATLHALCTSATWLHGPITRQPGVCSFYRPTFVLHVSVRLFSMGSIILI